MLVMRKMWIGGQVPREIGTMAQMGLGNVVSCFHSLLPLGLTREVCYDLHKGDQGFYLFDCFTSMQHLRSYQDGYRLLTVRIHGELIVLPQY